MKIFDLETPALLIDADALDHNLSTMAQALPGSRTRPHVKAHKCTALARRQKESGHHAFTCATVREVEGMAAAGLGEDLLLDNKVEFVLGVQEPHPDRTLVFHHVLSYDLVLITSEDHPLANRTTVSPEEASAWPAIVPITGTYSRQFGETAARQYGVEINAVIEVGGWGIIKRYVECGLGISVVPSIAVLADDRVAAIPLEGHFPTRSFGAYTRRGKYLTPPALRLLRLMIPDFPDPRFPPPLTDGRIAGSA